MSFWTYWSHTELQRSLGGTGKCSRSCKRPPYRFLHYNTEMWSSLWEADRDAGGQTSFSSSVHRNMWIITICLMVGFGFVYNLVLQQYEKLYVLGSPWLQTSSGQTREHLHNIKIWCHAKAFLWSRTGFISSPDFHLFFRGLREAGV